MSTEEVVSSEYEGQAPMIITTYYHSPAMLPEGCENHNSFAKVWTSLKNRHAWCSTRQVDDCFARLMSIQMFLSESIQEYVANDYSMLLY